MTIIYECDTENGSIDFNIYKKNNQWIMLITGDYKSKYLSYVNINIKTLNLYYIRYLAHNILNTLNLKNEYYWYENIKYDIKQADFDKCIENYNNISSNNFDGDDNYKFYKDYPNIIQDAIYSI